MTISLNVEIPEELHQLMSGFLVDRQDWDQDRTFATALSLFLLQQLKEAE